MRTTSCRQGGHDDAEGGWVMLLALWSLLMASMVVALTGALVSHQMQDLRAERDQVELIALRDAAIAHGLGLARDGRVPGGEQVGFDFEYGSGRLSGTVWETTGRRDQPGRGVYRIEVTATVRARQRTGRVTLNTFRRPARISGLEPAPAWRQ